jgi:hypothetical protein
VLAPRREDFRAVQFIGSEPPTVQQMSHSIYEPHRFRLAIV